ncbi:DNA ligase-1 [Scopulibacillus darangshiensis]|uniref:DNA ligase-1 n=1 Tax=Scopulibacillus darangshiensis TaxID=442528 RepID=A0A4R2NSG0_9BACL|nr:ATP-dependent DNA ligase [Scopulibacillus darangshiensis]TCP24481.1 DNA ligase-1 [Scopulibacillus darangshiensis]
MFIYPQLLETSPEPFDHSDVIWEPKMDGFRGILTRFDGKTTLYTRKGNVVTDRFPEFWEIPASGDFILDGEVICYDPQNKQIDFELAMQRFSTKSHSKVLYKSKTLPCVFVAWDILFYKGKDLRQTPLIKRKVILENVLEENEHFLKIRYIEGQGKAYFNSIKKINLEGAIAKFKQSFYVSTNPPTAKRSNHWLKVINWKYTNVYLTGYRKNPEFGWLAAIEENGQIKPVCIIEYGATPKERQAFYGVAKSLITKEDNEMVYLKPAIRAKIKFRNWTRKGYLRTPVFEEFIL